MAGGGDRWSHLSSTPVPGNQGGPGPRARPVDKKGTYYFQTKYIRVKVFSYFIRRCFSYKDVIVKLVSQVVQVVMVDKLQTLDI